MNTQTAVQKQSSASFFSNLNTRTKIYTGFGAVVLLLSGLGGMSWFSAQDGQHNLKAYTTQSRIVVSSSAAETDFIEARLAVRRFLASGAEADVADFNIKWADAESSLIAAKALMTHPENIKAADDILKLKTGYASSFRGVIEKNPERCRHEVA